MHVCVCERVCARARACVCVYVNETERTTDRESPPLVQCHLILMTLRALPVPSCFADNAFCSRSHFPSFLSFFFFGRGGGCWGGVGWRLE